uniref:Uncharacterized protein n=1 Tax=Orbilia brochopaga TaxID=3140254 RepID=A0A481ZN32_9PEZI|nr:hypothetical protein [Drechslerella brochopaga]QBL02516.1 hypothetical protein [Drechslerella brochopaga]
MAWIVQTPKIIKDNIPFFSTWSNPFYRHTKNPQMFFKKTIWCIGMKSFIKIIQSFNRGARYVGALTFARFARVRLDIAGGRRDPSNIILWQMRIPLKKSNVIVVTYYNGITRTQWFELF